MMPCFYKQSNINGAFTDEHDTDAMCTIAPSHFELCIVILSFFPLNL